MSYYQQGTAGFRRVSRALFAGGFVTFAILYSTQPLMPDFSREFHVSPTVASLSLSVTTASLAIFMLVAGTLSEAWGRKPMMTAALFSAAALGIITAFAPSFHTLLILRVLQGMVLSGLPAIAMAYLSEEIDPGSLGLAMGLYVSGNSIGGMSGRIIIGALTDLFNWRIAFASIGVLALLASLFFGLTLPPSQNFKPRPLQLGALMRSLWEHLQNPGLLCLYGIGFLLMGSFVTLYNYISYLLIAPPYNLSQTIVGFIFVIYLVGTFSSTWMGKLVDRYRRRNVLWIGVAIMLSGALLSLAGNLAVKIVAIALFTFGFFGAHSIASSWVGMQALRNKAQASSLYLFFYYVGSSVGGTTGGSLWSAYRWPGVISMIALFLCLAVVFTGAASALFSRQNRLNSSKTQE